MSKPFIFAKRNVPREKKFPRCARVKPVRSCRVCGCTEADCSGCVARTGMACAWAGPDLCTACAPVRCEACGKSLGRTKAALEDNRCHGCGHIICVSCVNCLGHSTGGAHSLTFD